MGYFSSGLHFTLGLTLSSSLEQIKDKLTLVSNQLENVERIGSNQDTMDVPEMLDDIRDAVNDCQVSTVELRAPMFKSSSNLTCRL